MFFVGAFDMYSRMNDIITKQCTKCQEIKPLNEFYPDSHSKDKHRNDCKKCNCESRKKWQKENLDKVLEKNRKWNEKNKEWVDLRRKLYAPKRREKCRNRYINDENYRNKRIQTSKDYRHNPKNKEAIQKTRRNSRIKNSKNPEWRMMMNLRRRLIFVLHGERKADTTEKLVGCSWIQLREHIEKQFKDGMSWDNYGKKGWHLDHIIPCDAFDLSIPEQQAKCFHYTNLQPLWWYDNLKKSNKLQNNP